MKPLHYTLIKYTHNLATEESANIGLLMWSPVDKRILFDVTDRYARLSSFFPDFEPEAYRTMVRRLRSHFANVAENLSAPQSPLFSKEIAEAEDLVNKFLPRDASCFQLSSFRGVFDDNMEARFSALLDELVYTSLKREDSDRHDETDIYSSVQKVLRLRKLAARVKYNVPINSKKASYNFRFGWDNAVRHVAEPISFDLVDPSAVLQKAYKWHGLLNLLGSRPKFRLTAIIARPSDTAEKAVKKNFTQAMGILGDNDRVERIVPEDEMESLAGIIEKDLESHPTVQ